MSSTPANVAILALIIIRAYATLAVCAHTEVREKGGQLR